MKNLTKKLCITIILVAAIICLGVTKVNAATTFSDVKTGSWYKDEVEYVSEHGIMNGTGNGKFSPDGQVTRGMFVTVLWRIEGAPISTEEISFIDVKKSDYYYEAVKWAAENEIVNGVGGGKFAPKNAITREQAATMIGRYLREYLPVNQISQNKFNDDGQIASYAKNDVYWLRYEGILEGTEKGNFNPKSGLKRSELASLAYRITQRVNEYYNIITATVIAENGLYVREQPNANANIVKNLWRGNTIEVIQCENGWAKLRYEKGYVSSVYLSFGTESKSNSEYNKTARVTSETGVNVRLTPSTNSEILITLLYGNVVKVASSQNGWTKVKVGRICGYISSQYLTTIGEFNTSGWTKKASIETDNHTTFDPSKYNAQLASTILTGVRIKPGETFSWIKSMGPCSGEKGFTESTTYLDTGVGTSSGGGICQVSTTINMAVKQLGIKTNAVQHMYRVPYANPEDEATVSYEAGVDFSFKNTTGKELMLIVETKNGYCTCGVWQKN